MSKHTKAVQEGMKWLDTTYPNWVGRIDLDHLEMADCMQCVLGQAFGNYHCDGTANLSYNDRIRCGFTIDALLSDRPDEEDEADWDELQNEWVRQIKNRREKS